jgi:hypothetical protein
MFFDEDLKQFQTKKIVGFVLAALIESLNIEGQGGFRTYFLLQR